MGIFNNNYVKGFIILTMLLPLISNCNRKCKKFKKNVLVAKLLTACELSVNNNATVCGDLTVNGKINGGPAYGYIYTTTRQEVERQYPVYFTNHANLLGITHIPNSQNIVVTSAGVYSIFTSISATGPIQFAIAVNGVADPSTIYGSSSGQNYSQCILTLAAGDIITLINHDSGAFKVIPDGVGGDILTNVHASIFIEKIS